MKYRSDSPQATAAWAEKMASALQGDELILLCGELGAGKTLFCKGLAQGMDLDADEVVSPTFTLMNCFDGPRHTLYHLDLYRIGKEPGGLTYVPEIDDQLGHGVIVVEWAEFLSPEYWRMEQVLGIDLEVLDNQDRLIRLRGSRASRFVQFLS